MVEYHPISATDLSRLASIRQESFYQAYSSAMRFTLGDSGKETFWSKTLRISKRWKRIRNPDRQEVLTAPNVFFLKKTIADGTV